jgi:hypothetical protein
MDVKDAIGTVLFIHKYLNINCEYIYTVHIYISIYIILKIKYNSIVIIQSI